MIVTLGEFEIANGAGRDLRVLATDSFTLTQETDEDVFLRAGWASFFTDRAVTRLPLSYVVTFPPCETLAAALLQSRQIPVLCPAGGVLTEELGTTLVTYASAKRESVSVQRYGLTNVFTFNLQATDPTTSLALSELAKLNMSYIANLPLITGLTGGGSTNLDGYVTLDVSVGLTAFITPTIGGLVQPKHFRLIAGTAAQNTDPSAGGLVVRPADYDGSTNAKVWVEC